MKRTLVISDLHLNYNYDPELSHYIVNLVRSVDQVIINGDFWDHYICSFDEFIASEWNQLFPLFREKNTVYIYGNHDKAKFMDDRVSFFSTKQADIYTLTSNDKKFVIEHGHRIAPEMDDRHPTLTRLFNRFYPRFYFYMLKDLWVTRFLHRKLIEPTQEKNDIKIQKQVSRLNDDSVTGYIFGHTHIFDESYTPKYINSGYFFAGEAHYLIIEDGKVLKISEMYW